MKSIVFNLFRKHQQLDEQLRDERSQKYPDFVRLARLKKMKLAVKDRLHRLSSGNHQHLA